MNSGPPIKSFGSNKEKYRQNFQDNNKRGKNPHHQSNWKYKPNRKFEGRIEERNTQYDRKLTKPIDFKSIDLENPEVITGVAAIYYKDSFLDDPWKHLAKKENKSTEYDQ